MDGQNDNSKRGCDGGIQRVLITLEPATMKWGIDFDTLNTATAIMMLESALRELDARYRFVRAQELLAEKIQTEQLAAVSREVVAGKNWRA